MGYRSIFLPDAPTESLRSLVRHRKVCSKMVPIRIENAKGTGANEIKIHTVINDLMGNRHGNSERILDGGEGTTNFLQFVDPRIRADHETIKKSLTVIGTMTSFPSCQNYELYILFKSVLFAVKINRRVPAKAISSKKRGIMESVTNNPKKANTRKTKNQPLFI